LSAESRTTVDVFDLLEWFRVGSRFHAISQIDSRLDLVETFWWRPRIDSTLASISFHLLARHASSLDHQLVRLSHKATHWDDRNTSATPILAQKLG
jgi:hypothetical protein